MPRLSPKATQGLAMAFIWGGGVVTVVILLVVIGYVLVQGLPGLSLDFLLTPPQGGLSGEGGISTVIVSTVYLVAVTIIILVPVGLGAAIYLAEYAPDNRLTRLIRYGVETLAGVPSIIFGLFGFALFVTALHFNFSILSGALTLVCLLLPTMIRTSEEAIKSVPYAHREAALALGTTRWQMISRVLLPTALPGIVTAVILCVHAGLTALRRPDPVFARLLPGHGDPGLRQGHGHRCGTDNYHNHYKFYYQLAFLSLPEKIERCGLI
jgi:phosphate transport system permease protein